MLRFQLQCSLPRPAPWQQLNWRIESSQQPTSRDQQWQAVWSRRAGGRSRSTTARHCPRDRTRRCTAAAAQPHEVVVVGGGVGGLATAGRLARAGLSVTLLERNAQVGGRLQSVEVDGCRWDTGPSLLLFPDKYREAFAALGSSLEEHVTIQRVEPAAYRVFFGADGSHLDLLSDPAAMAAQLEGVEPGAGDAFLRFRAMARRMLDLGVPNFIERDYNTLADAAALASMVPQLPGINPVDLLGQHDARLRQFFADPRLRALFTFQDLYVGLSPTTAPGVFSLLAGTELTDGVHYPLGGFATVRDGLLKAAQRCGVRVRTQAEVVSIDVDGSGKRVTGVTLASGERLPASTVVCNRDLPAAYELLGGSAEASTSSSSNGSSNGSANDMVRAYAAQQHEALGRLDYSAGVISFCWRLNCRLDALAHHSVFLSGDWEGSWRRATSADTLQRFPNFYVHAPARTDPSAAPPGDDSIMVLLPVANLQQMAAAGHSSTAGSCAAIDELVAAGRQRILQAFADCRVGQDVGSSITHEVVTTPPDWQRRYGLRHGAAFGLSHSLNQLSVFRPGTRDPRVAGLYFAGASTRPGNGVPLCLIGAKLTAERVLGDLRLPAVQQ